MSISEFFGPQGLNAKINSNSQKKDIPEGLWVKCSSCGESLFERELKRNLKVCPKCAFHHPLTAVERIGLLADTDSFEEFDEELSSGDPLNFTAENSYKESLNKAKGKTNLSEAVVTGRIEIEGYPTVVAVMDFRFMGGSMGSVVGEKVTRAIEKAQEMKLPLIAITASGGARMQEGMFSLMQMAKTSAAVARFHQAKGFFVSLLTHPTTGGTLASFASLADIILAEPKALIGFAGPRVIEKTIRQKLPRNFQSAEYLLEHGMIDKIIPRSEQKKTLFQLLLFFGGDSHA